MGLVMYPISAMWAGLGAHYLTWVGEIHGTEPKDGTYGLWHSMSCVDVAENISKPSFLLAKWPWDGLSGIPCTAPIQQRALLSFLELAYLHTSYNYHLHSQRHLLEMGWFHLLVQFSQWNLH